MKTLLLMRHAKSSWKQTDLKDFDRPLNKRGVKDTPVMGNLLVEHELIPQQILSSSAVRAKQTAELMAESLQFKGETCLLDTLYMAEVNEYVHAIRQVGDDVDTLMVIGHNPSMEILLQVLSGQIESLPTAVLAHIELPIDAWSDLTAETRGNLLEIWRPREIRKEVEKDKKGKDKKKKKD